jgi:hypothetical protein
VQKYVLAPNDPLLEEAQWNDPKSTWDE